MANKKRRPQWRAKVTNVPGPYRRRRVKWARKPHWSSQAWREAVVPLKVQHRLWDGWEGKEIRHVRVSRDFIRGAGRELRLLLAIELLERGLVRSSECGCSHCAADYDCCGRIIGGPVRATRIKGRTFRVEQSIYCNL